MLTETIYHAVKGLGSVNVVKRQQTVKQVRSLLAQR
jgi:hypothetical protein